MFLMDILIVALEVYMSQFVGAIAVLVIVKLGFSPFKTWILSL